MRHADLLGADVRLGPVTPMPVGLFLGFCGGARVRLRVRLLTRWVLRTGLIENLLGSSGFSVLACDSTDQFMAGFV
jgi:hypothetical protein